MDDATDARVSRRVAYASNPAKSRGRLFDEPPSPTRTAFERDRDRVIHSAAFRRLKEKTQVFLYDEGDHYRTRLTHSLEVAQIARALARTLHLDEDLAEALALAHDLGHPPFGHAGERALDAAMADYGGFDHNAQSLRVVTSLERRYPGFDGLNLTWETLEGLVKHNGPLTDAAGHPIGRYAELGLPFAVRDYAARQDLELSTYAGPEAQAAAIADDIAYDAHDIDDGLRAGLLSLDCLAETELVGDHPAPHWRRLSGAGAGTHDRRPDPPPDLDHDRRRGGGEPGAAGPACTGFGRCGPRRRPCDDHLLGSDGRYRPGDQGDAESERLSPPPGDGRDGQGRGHSRPPVRALLRRSRRHARSLAAVLRRRRR